MTPRLRKLLLTAHVTFAVGWFGAVAAFLALAIVGFAGRDAQLGRAAYLAMDLIAWFVIVPLCFASLLTGLVQALGSQWGLFRHYWILAKLFLTLLATIVLLLKMNQISDLAAAAAETVFSVADYAKVRKSLMVHAGGGLLVLLAATTLAVYKPQGMTRFAAGTPRWVKVSGVVAIALVLLVGIMVLTGHGPGVHA